MPVDSNDPRIPVIDEDDPVVGTSEVDGIEVERHAVAGDTYPDTEGLHPADPDGGSAGLSPLDTKSTTADPTPNTMEAAEANKGEKPIIDRF